SSLTLICTLSLHDALPIYSWFKRLAKWLGWSLAALIFNHFFDRTVPPYFFTYGAIVSNDRVYFDVTMRVGFHPRSSLATALAWVYPESASGRSASALVHDSAGIALASRNTINGMVANCLASKASQSISSGE